MSDDRTPLDDLLRQHVHAYDGDPERAASTRTAALDELRHARRRSSWRSRIEAGAMVTAAAAQVLWVFGALFGR